MTFLIGRLYCSDRSDSGAARRGELEIVVRPDDPLPCKLRSKYRIGSGVFDRNNGRMESLSRPRTVDRQAIEAVALDIAGFSIFKGLSLDIVTLSH